jgi:3-oxoacyl-[acyl-carrier-protein] synthase II
MTQSDRRVVVTGMGLISPLGHSHAEFWEALSQGTSGVKLLEAIPRDNFPSDFGGECQQFTGNIESFGELEKKLKRNIKKALRLMCREIQLGVAAAQLAITDANLVPESFAPTRAGTMFGSDYIVTSPFDFAAGMTRCLDENGNFDFEAWGEKGLSEVEPLWLLKYLPNMPASHVAIFNDLRGPSNSLTVREASANLAVAEAMTIIQRGSADVMIAGATGSRIHPLRTVHMALQEQLADRHTESAGGDPAKASRPFDADRTGMVIGEGAGVIVMEELSSAEKRGANILGEIIGYGSSTVADSNGVADYKSAFTNVLQGALETSQLQPADVGHVHAHGLSSPKCDHEEAVAIKEVLGDRPVTAAKSYFGNLGGGSGMVELIASLLALEHGSLFPVLNYETPDDQCPVSVVREQGTSPGETFINLNITPQGQASSAVFRKFK